MSLRLNENTFCGSEYTKLLPSTHILIWEGEITKKNFFFENLPFWPKNQNRQNLVNFPHSDFFQTKAHGLIWPNNGF